MKRTSLWAGIALLTVGAAARGQCDPVKVLRGVPVKVCLCERVASGDGAEGGAIPMAMAEDVLDAQKHVLISKGTPVVAMIEKSRAEGAWGRAGTLTFTVNETTAVDGSKVPLSGKIQRRGENRAALLGWNLFARGGNVKLKKGKTFTAIVDSDVVIDPAKAPSVGVVVATAVPAPTKGKEKGKAKDAAAPGAAAGEAVAVTYPEDGDKK